MAPKIASRLALARTRAARRTGWSEGRHLPRLLRKVKPYTMVPEASLTELARIVRAALTFDVPGAFVECGAWRGGAAFLMAELLRREGAGHRKVWGFDSFEGLPAPQKIDGTAAIQYARNTNNAEYYDNCRASLPQAQRDCKKLGLSSYVRFVKGWFENTLAAHRKEIGPIAVLRIDGNWHASVRCCLDTLFDQVVDGGFVLLHTYYTYEGCAVATHEFLGERHLGHPIEGVAARRENIEDFESALFRKSTTTWRAMRQEYQAAEDIAAVVPRGETVILTGPQQWENLPTGYRIVPFLEAGGEYNGPPENDVQAISELRRLKGAGTSFLVVPWPAFWWFDSYRRFHHWLKQNFPCRCANERVVIFDLR